MKLNSMILAVPLMAAALLTNPVNAQKDTVADDTVVTGQHWVESADDVKDGYLVGVVSMIDVEDAVQGSKPGDPSVVPVLKKGLHDMTITDVKMAVDEYYASNQDNLDKPVMHVIWDIAVQNSR